jgi:glutamate-1-semialdehyde 2,1-aminomutase
LTRSEELHKRAKELMPAGVSSPVRAYEPFPRFIRSGKGSKIRDVDGNEYIDYCMAFGPLILGHAPPPVVRAVKAAISKGSVFGAPTEQEVLLAEKIRKHYPAGVMLRFVNTGTEATMHAIRLARGYTLRKKIVKVEGAYHGAHDAMLVRAGSGALTHSMPNSLGVLEDLAKHTVLVPFNDAQALRKAIREAQGDVAAMILEPVLGNVGPILPKEGYLKEVREITRAADVLLIFDEVITGFRLGLGGAQEMFGVRPDLFTMGKIVGGGYPIGVFAGRRDIMTSISPLGGVYQAGTFSGNPVSITGGLETIRAIEKRGYGPLNRRSEKLRKGLEDVFSRTSLPHRVSGIGSMFQVFFTGANILNWNDARASDTATFMKMFRGLLDEGVYTPPSQFETNFLSMAHSDADIEFTLAAYERTLRGMRR